MCGILGLISSLATEPEKSKAGFRFALEALRPRGPDGKGLECGKGWLLGHTRLAILDLTEKAHQPMTDDHGGWLIYNGEIYNFKELREELTKLGYQFRSSGDTEVLLHAMREWGVSCLSRLRGMFAFGWLDSKRQELILCRDRYGVKPLAYEIKDNELRFASDLHALRRLPGASQEIDPESAYLYMALGYVPAPYSILKHVRKVKPGHYLRVNWTAGGALTISEHSYWSIQQIPVSHFAGSPGLNLGYQNVGKDSYLLDGFENQITESIRYRLISDQPIGILLSGGIDSTLVTAICRGQAQSEIPSFTMGFEDPKVDEAPFARALAKQLGGQHEEFYIRESDVLKVWEKLWEIYDEPFADSSALPMAALCERVSARVKVALTGDGGDEVFAGYPWHRALDRLNHSMALPKLFRHIVAGIGTNLGPTLQCQTNVFDQSDRVAQWSALRTGLTDASAKSLPVEEASKLPPLSAYFREWSKEIESITDPLEWACRMDLLTYLPDDLMVKADRASMSVGLELREPLLDHEMTTWCLALPIANRYDRKNRTAKLLPRGLLDRRVPKPLINRPKQGFVPPLNHWLKGPLRDVVNNALERIEHGDLLPLSLPGGCRTWPECAGKLNDFSQQFLWRIICFSEWLKHHHSLRLTVHSG